jgi:hypothetical protein
VPHSGIDRRMRLSRMAADRERSSRPAERVIFDTL